MRDFEIQNGVLVAYHGSDEYVYIPEGVTEIGEAAFREADFIRYVNIPETVTYIGKSAFEDCYNLESIDFPDSVSVIGESAFSSCRKLVIYELPYYLEKIEFKAFWECESLTSLDLLENVNEIGVGVFHGCSSLKMINVAPNNITYTSWDGVLYNKDMSVLVFYPWNRDMSNVKLPKSVTRIGIYAFAYSRLSKIRIHTGIKVIDGAAFIGCCNLVNILLPEGVTDIGTQAFSGCSNLENLYIPDSVNWIGKGAFECCYNMSTTITDFITEIRSNTFYGCTNLTELDISPRVKEIAPDAFEDCPNLFLYVLRGSYAEDYAIEHDISYEADDTYCDTYSTDDCEMIKKVWSGENYISLSGWDFADTIDSDAFSADGCTANDITVFIPSNIKTIAVDAFNNADIISIEVDSNNSIYKDIDGVLFSRDGTRLISYPYGRTNSFYRVPDGVTVIGRQAFGWNKYLTEIELPDSLQKIEEDAFRGLSITQITIPKNVQEIDGSALFDCEKLSAVQVEVGNFYFLTRNGVLFSNKGKELVVFPRAKGDRKYIIPSGVEVIGKGAFYNNPYLSDITFPRELRSIEKDAFNGCDQIESIDLKDNLIDIGSCAFQNCDKLTSVHFSSVVNIGKYAFCGTKIRNLVLPEGLLSIDEYAFEYTELRYVVLPSSVNYIDSRAFLSDIFVPDLGHVLFTVPHNSYAEQYCIFDNRVYEYSGEAPEDTETNDTPDENECSSDFEISDGILTSYAGSDTDISVPCAVEVIGDSAFSGQKEIQSISLPDSLIKIDEYAFSGCKQLNWINIPDSVEEIGEFAFSGCKLLESLVLPESVNTIGEDAFTGCGQLVLTVTSGSYAEQYAIDNDIEYCSNSDDYSDDFTVEDGVLTAYTGNESEVTVPNCVNKIADMVFKGHSEITELVLPDSLERIGEYAFSGCKGLTEIAIPYGTRYIGEFAFSGCRNLTSVTVPDTVCEIGDCAFSGCKSLNAVVDSGSVAESYMDENGIQYSCN